MADKSPGVVMEATAARSLVEKLILDDKAHVDSFLPAVALGRDVEPVIQTGKLTVVKGTRCDDDAIDIAASLIEGFVSQRAPEVNANEILAEYGAGIFFGRFIPSDRISALLGP
jgi:hypothetical protein